MIPRALAEMLEFVLCEVEGIQVVKGKVMSPAQALAVANVVGALHVAIREARKSA